MLTFHTADPNLPEAQVVGFMLNADNQFIEDLHAWADEHGVSLQAMIRRTLMDAMVA